MNAESGFQAELDAARTGEEWALRALYRRLHPRLLRYLLAHEPRHAEQLAHDVWLDVAGSLELFDGDEPAFRVWLFALARTRVLELNDGSGDWTVELPRATAAALQRICALPREEADVILLRGLAQLTSDQVASVVGRAPSHVRALQQRAVQRLVHYGERVA